MASTKERSMWVVLAACFTDPGLAGDGNADDRIANKGTAEFQLKLPPAEEEEAQITRLTLRGGDLLTMEALISG